MQMNRLTVNLLISFILLCLITGFCFVVLYFYVKSLSYHWDDKEFIGKKIDDIAPYLSEKWMDLGVKGFTIHEVKSDSGLIYFAQLGYEIIGDSKIILQVSNKIIFQFDNGYRLFEKSKISDMKGKKEEIMLHILWYQLVIGL